MNDEILWELVRTHLYDDCTIGELRRNRLRVCYTLEDAYRGDDMSRKIKGETAIPCGVYGIVVDYSPKFKRQMPRVTNVKGFEGIRIHGGNSKDHTNGCPLVAYERDLKSRLIWNTAESQVTALMTADSKTGNLIFVVKMIHDVEIIIDEEVNA